METEKSGHTAAVANTRHDKTEFTGNLGGVNVKSWHPEIRRVLTPIHVAADCIRGQKYYMGLIPPRQSCFHPEFRAASAANVDCIA